MSVHAQEAVLQEARAYQKTPEGRARLRERVVIEHRLARLAQLGIGQARYVGREKTRFQLMMACSIANLRRTWNWEADQEGGSSFDVPVGAAGGRGSGSVGLLGALQRVLGLVRGCWSLPLMGRFSSQSGC